MMFNFRKRKGFSLIELLIAITIMLLLVGLAAWYLDDYLYKSKVSKAAQDLDMFAGAIRLYDSLENLPFATYCYNTLSANPIGGTKYFSFYPVAMASFGTPMGTIGGATTNWTDYSANSLTSLIGTYLKTVPPDPWGSPYLLNTSSGVLSSMGADLLTCVGGNSFGITETGRSRDIVNYYLGDKLVLSTVYVWDNNNNGTIDAGEYIDFTFNRDVQAATGMMSPDNLFRFSADGLTSWLQPSNAAFAGANITSASATITPTRLINNGRILRYVFSGGVAIGSLVGKFAKVNISDTTNNVNPLIIDSDQYAKQPATSYSRGSFGKCFASSVNAPVEIKVRTF